MNGNVAEKEILMNKFSIEIVEQICVISKKYWIMRLLLRAYENINYSHIKILMNTAYILSIVKKNI